MSDQVLAAPHVRSFKRRGGRLRSAQAEARERFWPAFGVDVDGRRLDLVELFGRVAPMALEIGFGMGEATVEAAAERPELDVLAVEVHVPGHGALLRAVADAGLTNVRVADGDAVEVLRDMLPSQSLTEVRAYFPDPWPKRRHHKRRLVRPEVLDLVADRLAPGGLVHLATDWTDYAVRSRALLAAHPAFAVTDEVPWRPVTGYERRGLAAGRPPHDVVALRR
ncbi:MAG TPA: tRNA (guanosine(46)-N7)-methyltransferase TrmB [Jiangellales bacterium]|nr:tRNA (guanosine(46)-N7)-methyltransferase TrmB [Jiangellales bacterium]